MVTQVNINCAIYPPAGIEHHKFAVNRNYNKNYKKNLSEIELEDSVNNLED